MHPCTVIATGQSCNWADTYAACVCAHLCFINTLDILKLGLAVQLRLHIWIVQDAFT